MGQKNPCKGRARKDSQGHDGKDKEKEEGFQEKGRRIGCWVEVGNGQWRADKKWESESVRPVGVKKFEPKWCDVEGKIAGQRKRGKVEKKVVNPDEEEGCQREAGNIYKVGKKVSVSALKNFNLEKVSVSVSKIFGIKKVTVLVSKFWSKNKVLESVLKVLVPKKSQYWSRKFWSQKKSWYFTFFKIESKSEIYCS